MPGKSWPGILNDTINAGGPHKAPGWIVTAEGTSPQAIV